MCILDYDKLSKSAAENLILACSPSSDTGYSSSLLLELFLSDPILLILYSHRHEQNACAA